MARIHRLTHPVLGPVSWHELRAHVKAIKKAEQRKACWWCWEVPPGGLRTCCWRNDCGSKIRYLCYPADLHYDVVREEKVCRMCGASPVPYGTGRPAVLLQCDHIIPIAEGGTSDRSNLRALCVACHKRETAALAARLAKTRNPDMQEVLF